MIRVVLPEALAGGSNGRVVEIHEPVANVGELLNALEVRRPGLRAEIDSSIYSVAVNGEILLIGREERPLADGDEVEILTFFAGG